MHKLIITPRHAETACGIEVSAFYPDSEYATPVETGMERFKCTPLDDGRITCEKCLEKMKGQNA